MRVDLFSPECLVESGEGEWPLETRILHYLLLDTIPVHIHREPARWTTEETCQSLSNVNKKSGRTKTEQTLLEISCKILSNIWLEFVKIFEHFLHIVLERILHEHYNMEGEYCSD